jgi:quercetin dioxygenase-like cupin family protein
MRYERLYSDQDGETHFQRVELDLKEMDYRPPAPLLFVSHAREASAVQFVRLPAGWEGKSITPPQQQYLICLQGQLEIVSSSGAKRTIQPGETVLMEDTSGKGHHTRVLGGTDCIAAIVALT